MDKMVAYCGLVCTECPAFMGTQNNDMEALAVLAVEWSAGGPAFAPEDMLCDGCLATDGRLFKWCQECELRSCASERGVATCAHCPDYGCGKLQKVFAMGEMGQIIKQQLDAIRAEL
ncbi:MAG: DUF3795 domain-containing protein [Anaerolineae bacterium]|nr:DUF3795 domain-containing protein [Anaerolineae bacterium]